MTAYEEHLQHLDVLEDRISINEKIAEIYQNEMGDDASAFQVLERAAFEKI